MKSTFLKSPTFTKNGFAKALGTLALGCAISPLSYAEWSVQGSQILDPSGEPFVYRGVNLGILPPADSLPQVYADIAATGANAIRIPIDNMSTAQAEIHVNLCKQHKLVCVFAYTLSAGYTDSFRAPGSLHVLDVWPQFVDLLKANEDYVTVDLASAMAGNLAGTDYHSSYYQTVITLMRIWGVKNQLIISGGNWGQDWGFVMRDHAEALLAFDSLRNTVLSVHMYEAYRDAQTVRSYLESFTTRNLPLMISEFGPIKRDRYNEYRNPYATTDVAVDAIMDISQELGVGYLGWNWSGYKAINPNPNSLPDYSALNMVSDFNPLQVTPWGNLLINSNSGIKATAQRATHFPEGSSSSSSSSVGNQPPRVDITYSLTTAGCGALAGQANAAVSDPDGDALSYSWEVYQSATMTSTYGTGQSIAVTWPAQAETVITLTVDDGQGNVAKKVKTLGKNNNADTCSSASSTSSANPISSVSSTSSASSTFSVQPISSTSSISSARSTSSARISSASSTALVSSASSNVAISSARSSSSIAAQTNCRYVVHSQWDTGFTAAIRMTNTGSQPINGWNINWRYSDGSSITGSWNTALSGNNPYSAKNVNWNATIWPGQTVEFGFQGKKSKGAAQIPVVSGSVCQ